MIDDHKNFVFKSSSPNFEKERLGIKPNTVRLIDLQDERFLYLIAHNMVGYNPGDLTIRIKDAKGNTVPFTRDIDDITIWDNRMVISWKHKK